jgi:beta-glucuronidase
VVGFHRIGRPTVTTEEESMLKPQISATRELLTLDGLWRFVAGDLDHAPGSQTLPGTLEAPVPASYNDLFVAPSLREHVGWVWYQRTVRVPRGWANERVFVRVDAATHAGRVYVGEQLVAEHVGGYTPFEADITDLVRPGDEFRLTIGVDNTLTNETIPPGTVEVTPTGARRQRYLHDFFNYAGLARSVAIYSAPANRVEDLTVTTEIDGTTGVVQVKTVVAGVGTVRLHLEDADGVVVASADGTSTELRVPDALLWGPGSPNLYTLRVVLERDGLLADEYVLPVGIRTVRVDGLRLLVNDEPVYLTGFGKHEDTPVRGKGHDDAYLVHDFALMGWTGANSFRTSHYPYAEEVLEYADRHGYLVIDETAAVGLNLNIGGGIFGSSGTATFSPDTINDRTQAAHAQALRELVGRDKNHPSVILWSVANEPASNEAGAREYFEPLIALTRELDPSRPVTFVNLGMATPEADRVADLVDVICLNRYFGWYEDTADLASAEMHLEDELRRWQDRYNRPLIVTEYGADAVAGLHAVHTQPWTEEYQRDVLDLYHRVHDRIEAVVGEQVWNFADFQTSSAIFRVDGNKKGVFTRDRRPKAAAHLLRTRWTTRQH